MVGEITMIIDVVGTIEAAIDMAVEIWAEVATMIAMTEEVVITTAVEEVAEEEAATETTNATETTATTGTETTAIEIAGSTPIETTPMTETNQAGSVALMDQALADSGALVVIKITVTIAAALHRGNQTKILAIKTTGR